MSLMSQHKKLLLVGTINLMFHKDQLKAILGRTLLGAFNGDYGCKRDFRSWLFSIDDNVGGAGYGRIRIVRGGEGGFEVQKAFRMAKGLIQHSLYAAVWGELSTHKPKRCVHLIFCFVIGVITTQEREERGGGIPG
jgi:hypothetical protein